MLFYIVLHRIKLYIISYRLQNLPIQAFALKICTISWMCKYKCKEDRCLFHYSSRWYYSSGCNSICNSIFIAYNFLRVAQIIVLLTTIYVILYHNLYVILNVQDSWECIIYDDCITLESDVQLEWNATSIAPNISPHTFKARKHLAKKRINIYMTNNESLNVSNL